MAVTTTGPSRIRFPTDAAVRHRIAVLAGTLAGTVFLTAVLIGTVGRRSASYAPSDTPVEARSSVLTPLLHADVSGDKALIGETHQGVQSARVAALTRRARMLCDAGNFGGATEYYHAILELVPRDVEAQLALGSIALYQHRYSEAESYLSKLLAQLPNDDPVVRMRLGSAQFRGGKIGIGLENLNRALAACPDDGALCFEVACAYATLGEKELAYYYLECARQRLGSLLLAFISDHHLDSIRQEKRFKELLQRARADAARPKRSDSGARGGPHRAEQGKKR